MSRHRWISWDRPTAWGFERASRGLEVYSAGTVLVALGRCRWHGKLLHAGPVTETLIVFALVTGSSSATRGCPRMKCKQSKSQTLRCCEKEGRAFSDSLHDERQLTHKHLRSNLAAIGHALHGAGEVNCLCATHRHAATNWHCYAAMTSSHRARSTHKSLGESVHCTAAWEGLLKSQQNLAPAKAATKLTTIFIFQCQRQWIHQACKEHLKTKHWNGSSLCFKLPKQKTIQQLYSTHARRRSCCLMTSIWRSWLQHCKA